jgi:hypothetical protein
MNERWIHVTARLRGTPRLDDPELAAVPEDPSIDALRTLAEDGGRSIVLAGGEPTLRADLPELIAALRGASLRTDGLALRSPGAVQPLRAAGLASVRVLLHSAQPAAHDWLVGMPGAARAAMRALQVAAEAGLRTEIEAALTRSTAPVLAQLVELAERLGVRAVFVRGLADRGAATREPLTVALGLLGAPLDAARVAATRGRVRLVVHDLPKSALPELASVVALPDAVEHAFVAHPDWDEVRASYAPRAEVARGLVIG